MTDPVATAFPDMVTEPAFLAGGGEMGALMRAHDWSTSPVGDPSTWPQSLRSVVQLMLSNRQLMFVAWGPELAFLYNDGYAPALGAKHPSALGRPSREVWSDIWGDIEPLVAEALAGGTTWSENLHLVMERNGYPEDAWFTFSCSPLRDESGAIAGMFCAGVETTGQVLAERRMRESEARARGVLEGMGEAFVLLDRSFRIVDINAEGLRLEARARDEIIGGVHWEVWPGAESSELGHLLKRAMSERVSVTIENRYVWPDGREGWFEVRAYPTGDGLAVFYRDVTERVRAERALRETSRRLNAVLDNTREAVFLMDERQHCLFANAAAEKLTGFAFTDMEGRPLHDVVHHKKPDGSHYPIEECPIDRAFPERARMSGEELFVARDGSFYPVAFTASPVLDDGGRPVGTVIEARSIADERARDAALRESEARFRNMADQAPVMTWVTDANGYCTYLNRRWYDFTGQTPEEAEGLGWLDATHPDDKAEAERVFLDANARAEPFRIEYRLRRADGTHRWAIDAASPRFGAQGEFLGYVGSVVDIDERREAEDRLRQSEARYRALFDTIDEGFCVIEFIDGPHGPLSDYVHIEANPAYTANAGIPDIVGKRLRQIVGDEADAWAETYRNVLLTGEPIRFERELEATGRHLELAAFRVEPESRRQVAVLFQDVTDRKRAENALRELNETLEERVAEEVAERARAEEALRQAQKMEAVGQLTGGIAHDFNNLLTGITGSLEMMQVRMAQGRTGDVDRYLTAAQGAASRAASLTHRLLAFSRRQTLAPKPTDVKALVTGMEELIGRSVGPGIQVETVNAAGLWPSLIDSSQLENAILNLCINARDAMPDGGRITIETGNRWMDRRTAAERGLEPGQYISVCVSDTGAGMPPEVMNKVFEPFFTTKPIGMGTGLGLSMIYGFAKQSGGTVSIYSEVGQGTMVCVYLPRHVGAAEVEEAGDESGDAPGAAAGETVLIIDDEPTVRMLVAEILTDLGYTALEAGDGAAGLKIVQSDVRIDLLVTDVGLPGGMNGRQVADAARVARPGLKVLFITGYAENAVLSHGHLDPGMHVLTKPFAMEALASRIRELIND